MLYNVKQSLMDLNNFYLEYLLYKKIKIANNTITVNIMLLKDIFLNFIVYY